MNISITARGYKAPERLKKYITEKLSKMSRFHDRILGAEVILSYEKQTQVAEFKIQLNHKTLIAKEKSDDIFKSIDYAIDNIERQIKKAKDKLKQHDSKKVVEVLEK